jgi:Asp-tRNA(Asn)/Glu-tRNA(Gln) amidotransferase A subunit family amidase
MPQSRRRFLARTTAGLVGAAAVARRVSAGPGPDKTVTPPPAGMPTVYGTAPPVGPEITPATIVEAQKLVRIEFTSAEQSQIAESWARMMAGSMERRTGPRKLALEDTLAPATLWNPLIPGVGLVPMRDRFVRSTGSPGPLPKRDEDIAFAPVTSQSRWIESRALTSERLTRIYIERCERLDPKLRSIITLTKDVALAQAKQADAEIASGKYRGPLHGIPFGVKDLMDTKGIVTTYGAEFYRNRVPTEDSAVVARLQKAGAVLLAKLSLGALALNDVWFGGQTMNPWLLEEGSGGSSAGPGSATAAALVGFSVGSETGGSIIDPTMRCGLAGLRPTFGRVPRTGAMTLSWTCDKLGPMTRGVEDTLLVLQAISGPDPGDLYSLPSHLDFDATAPIQGMKLGYIKKWMTEEPATKLEPAALEALTKLGMTPVEVELPDWPYDSLGTVVSAEGAAAFEEQTLSGKMNELKMQVPDAWPNIFRQARFLSAVDFVQADRLRRKVAMEMERIFRQVDVLLTPPMRGEILTITNFTGHPALALRTGFVEVTVARNDWAPDPKNPVPTFKSPRRVPHGVSLIGRLFDEGTLGTVGMALEKASGVAGERPPGF